MQFLADVLNIEVERSAVAEATALGAACLAGVQSGVFDSREAGAAHWRREARFRPSMPPERREALLAGWRRAVSRVRSG